MKRPTINDYPQTDSRTYYNLDGAVNWKKYAEALEEYADSLSPAAEPLTVEPMTAERIKEIQMSTAYLDSVSVYQALLQVWNECAQAKPTVAERERWGMSDNERV